MQMNSVCRDIFKAIHEGKWLKIEYKNQSGETTKYWIGIRDLDPMKRTLKVDGLHLGLYTVSAFDKIFVDSILSSEVIEGSYCPINQELVGDISIHPERYKKIFQNVSNLKILSYLEMCNRLDTTPYYTDYELVHYLDQDSFKGETYPLSRQQFEEIIQNFQYQLDQRKKQVSGALHVQQLAMNVLSLHTKKGLYVLAYRKLNLDVKNKCFHPDEDITVCTEFTIDGNKENIRRYLDADEYELLEKFTENQEQIKDVITRNNPYVQVSDMPYVIGLGMDIVLDLHEEYNGIIEMYQTDEVTYPMKAFFGDVLSRPVRRKTYPIALINQNINLDQLLAINNAMKNPIAYIQGPPGTGKTNTIINTLVTAFFNEKTVLFSSYNNIPIDGVFDKLRSLKYHEHKIPFPILRLGNHEKTIEAIQYIQCLRREVADVKVFGSTLDKRKGSRIDRARQLSDLLKNYEEILDLKERRETLLSLMEYQEGIKNTIALLPFQADLQGYQLQQIEEKITAIGEITEEDALSLLDQNEEEFYQYLYYTSAGYIKKLETGKYEDLRRILDEGQDPDKQAVAFRKYLSETENVKKLQKVFPIMVTTCISAHRLGKPEPIFDMTIMDEASQCNIAMSLVPIIRGKELMLVGDPQQLSPVILLDDLTNQKLKRKYHVADEYDYKKNSIYKSFLACDAVSDEVLLHNHYRCNRKIIEFNNRKYYNSRLNICSKQSYAEPLIYLDVKGNPSDLKNVSLAEVEQIVSYAKLHKDQEIGVITPFVNQRNAIEEAAKEQSLINLSCGTVHAFQGDEKDVVLFSTAITENTKQGTYQWLKNNKELINVATSRAKNQLIVLADTSQIERLHKNEEDDDLYELIQYVRTNGTSVVTPKQANSRALGVKPFSTKTEAAFLENLTHALENIWLSQNKFSIHKEVAISQVFQENTTYDDLFYMGRFDFVVYEKSGNNEIPMLAIELDGKEHLEDEVVRERDRKKNRICEAHNLQIIRVENSYARRYNYIKEILLDYFSRKH